MNASSETPSLWARSSQAAKVRAALVPGPSPAKSGDAKVPTTVSSCSSPASIGDRHRLADVDTEVGQHGLTQGDLVVTVDGGAPDHDEVEVAVVALEGVGRQLLAVHLQQAAAQDGDRRRPPARRPCRAAGPGSWWDRRSIPSRPSPGPIGSDRRRRPACSGRTTAVPVRPTIPRATPTSAERTGTAVRPRAALETRGGARRRPRSVAATGNGPAGPAGGGGRPRGPAGPGGQEGPDGEDQDEDQRPADQDDEVDVHARVRFDPPGAP